MNRPFIATLALLASTAHAQVTLPDVISTTITEALPTLVPPENKIEEIKYEQLLEMDPLLPRTVVRVSSAEVTKVKDKNAVQIKILSAGLFASHIAVVNNSLYRPNAEYESISFKDVGTREQLSSKANLGYTLRTIEYVWSPTDKKPNAEICFGNVMGGATPEIKNQMECVRVSVKSEEVKTEKGTEKVYQYSNIAVDHAAGIPKSTETATLDSATPTGSK